MTRSGPERVFLGWDKPLLTESLNWLLQKYPSGFENLIIGVPGGRKRNRNKPAVPWFGPLYSCRFYLDT